MDNDKQWWAPALGAAVLLVLLASLALVAAFGGGWFKAFLTGQAADWAQAIGAVVAIVVAYRMGRVQIHADRLLEVQRRSKDDLRRVEIIDAVLANAEKLCLEYQVTWDERQGIPVAGPVGKHWQDSRTSIANIDPFQSPASAIVLHLAQLPRQIDHLIEAHEDLRAAFLKEPGHGDLRECFERLQQTLDRAVKVLGEARTACSFARSRIETLGKNGAY